MRLGGVDLADFLGLVFGARLSLADGVRIREPKTATQRDQYERFRLHHSRPKDPSRFFVRRLPATAAPARAIAMSAKVDGSGIASITTLSIPM